MQLLPMASSDKGWFFQCNYLGGKLENTEPIILAFELGARKAGAASGMFSAGEKGFPWHWHWVNKAFCYSFCRTALVGGVHIHWGVTFKTWAYQIQSFGGYFAQHFVLWFGGGFFSEIFVFWLQQLLLHFHPQFAMVQLFNRWIASNSFFAFNSHSLKLNEQSENNICFRRNFLIQENVKWHHSYKSTFYSFTKSRTICFLLIKMIWKIHWFVVFVQLRFLMIKSQSRSPSWERRGVFHCDFNENIKTTLCWIF